MSDPKEQKLIEARAEADLKWDEARRECVEAYRKRDEDGRNCVLADLEWVEADRKSVEADRKLRKYQESIAQQGGKAGG